MLADVRLARPGGSCAMRKPLPEPWRVKVVERVELLRREERERLLVEGGFSLFKHPFRGGLHRPVHRLRHLGDVRLAVGRHDAGRRGLRRRPQLLPSPGVDPGRLRLPALPPRPPGARGREPPVLDCCSSPAGHGDPQQHPLRHHPRQHRGQWRHRARPRHPRGARPAGPSTPSRATWTSTALRKLFAGARARTSRSACSP